MKRFDVLSIWLLSWAFCLPATGTLAPHARYSGTEPARPECTGQGGGLPASGAFAMHGRPVDVLPDGHALLFVRARHYDLRNGRWLQRDPKGYIDGGNLYEAFGNNALSNLDPEGAGIITLLSGAGYEPSDWQFIKNTLSTAGGIAADMKFEFSRTIGGAAGMTPPSKAQQRLVNLVNAEARYGGQTDTVELFGRATLMGVCDTVGLTSLDTTATGNIFIFTESGEVYPLQASGFERVQAGVAGFGQAAGSAALTLTVGKITTATADSAFKTLGSLRHGGTIGESPLLGARVVQSQLKLSSLMKGGTTAVVSDTGAIIVYNPATGSAGAVKIFVGAAPSIGAVRYGPHVKGPLPEGIANTFRGGSYTQAAVQSETALYRVYGGKASKIAPWWSRTVPQGPLQAQLDLALKHQWGNTAQNVVQIMVPQGTTIYEGFAARQGGLLGGGSQVYIPKVDPAWVVKP